MTPEQQNVIIIKPRTLMAITLVAIVLCFGGVATYYVGYNVGQGQRITVTNTQTQTLTQTETRTVVSQVTAYTTAYTTPYYPYYTTNEYPYNPYYQYQYTVTVYLYSRVNTLNPTLYALALSTNPVATSPLRLTGRTANYYLYTGSISLTVNTQYYIGIWGGNTNWSQYITLDGNKQYQVIANP